MTRARQPCFSFSRADAMPRTELKPLAPAEAMRAYAQKAKDLELVWWAAELKLDAERKAARMLAEMALRPGRKWSHAATNGALPPGITKSESSRWQAAGAVTDQDYEAWKYSLKGEAFPTSSELRNFAKRQAAEQENGPHRTNAISDLAALADM